MKLIKGLFFDNLLLKLVALAIAVSLVVTKRDDRVIRVKKMVGLELKYPHDRVLISMLPPQIELTIEGPYHLIRKLEEERENTPFSPYRIQFDGSENGVYNFQKDYYSLPPGLNLKAISPSSMVVTFDERTEKRLAVSPSFMGKLPNGYRLNSQILSPDFVTAFGPKSVLEKLEKVDTRTISLSDRTVGGVIEVALKDPPLFVEFSIDSPRVNLTVDIEEVTEERVFEQIPVGLKGKLSSEDKRAVRVSPSTVSVAVEGPLRILNRLQHSQMLPFVDLDRVEGDGVEVLKVELESLPSEVKWAINPNKVSLVTTHIEKPRRTGSVDAESKRKLKNVVKPKR
ncbi:MAG: CdaR family protein [Bradymonadia bacterium]